MNRLINFILRMPVEMLAGGMGLIASTVREFHEVFKESADTLIPPYPKQLPNISIQSSCSEVSQNEDIQVKNRSLQSQETKSMYDNCDTGNNDELKYVTYSIVFRKRDFEATLQAERQEVIDYPISTFCNLKVADFLRALAQGLPTPREWENGCHPIGEYGYPLNARLPATFSAIPANEQKWIECVARVVKTVAMAEKEYDKAQAEAQQRQAQRQEEMVDVLREIRNRI
ncbi:MAG: hypothetical protein ABL921_04590 [Pirellula sp.]